MEKVNQIIQELNSEMIHQKNVLTKYKKCHFVLTKLQLISNSISIGCGSSAAVTIATGVGIPASVTLSTVSAIFAGMGVMCSVIDQRLLKKIHKHYQLMVLARTLDLRLFQKHLCDEEVNEQDVKNILEMMGKYYQQKDMIETNSLFVSKNIEQLAKEFRIALNGSGQ